MCGSPYAVKTTDLASLQDICSGHIDAVGQRCEQTRVAIHPMFYREDGRQTGSLTEEDKGHMRWGFADNCLATAQMKNKGAIYVNDNGMNTCDPNMATINRNAVKFFPGSCPHVYGNIAIVMNSSQLSKCAEDAFCGQVGWRDIIEVYDTDEDRWENPRQDEDDEESESEDEEEEEEQTEEEIEKSRLELEEKLKQMRAEMKDFLKGCEKSGKKVAKQVAKTK